MNQQCNDVRHIIILMLLFFYGMAGFLSPSIQSLVLGILVITFIVLTFKRIISIIIWAVVILGAVLIFPFLAPFAVLLMIYLLVSRIHYLYDNWRPVLVGLIFYGYLFSFMDIHRYLLVSKLLRSLPIEILLVFSITCIMHFLLNWVYRHYYSIDEALYIMITFPLLIILILLAFVHVVDGFDAPDGVDGDFAGANHDAVNVRGDVPPPDGYHYTHSYDRIGPSGDIVHVRGYVASNPDGIIENNLSYHGNSTSSMYSAEIPHSSSNVTSDVYAYDNSKHKNNIFSNIACGFHRRPDLIIIGCIFTMIFLCWYN